MNNKALAKGLAKVSVAVLVLSLVAFSVVNIVLPVLGVDVPAVPAIWTDKPDYAPGETVYIFGSGFNPFSAVQINVTRPDNVVDVCPLESRCVELPITDELGSFSNYIYVLNGIEGNYTVTASEGTNSAQTTFNDATEVDTYSDSGRTTSASKFLSGATVYGRIPSPGGHGSLYASRYVWKNQAGTTVRTSDCFSEGDGPFDDSYTLTGAALGSWSVVRRYYDDNHDCINHQDSPRGTETTAFSVVQCLAASDCPDKPNTNKACTSNVCAYTCTGNFKDCNNNKTLDGCEVNIMTDFDHCGSCSGAGHQCTTGQTCVSGTCTTSCTPTTEVCDGIDNDCDGSIDESLTRPTTCGVGACSGNVGTETCTAGVWGANTCNPLAGATTEVCTGGADEDCDGLTDCADSNCKPCITIVADKIVCDAEAKLPNWGGGANDITESTAATYVSNHPGCVLTSGWNFQYSSGGQSNPGDNIEHASSPWVTFGPTDSNGRTSVVISKADNSLWFREELKSGFIGFSGATSNYNSGSNNVTAEFYCNGDVLNYDNYDNLDGETIDNGDTFYCVGFNALTQFCGNGIREGTELCDGGDCCTAQCTFKSSTETCRASAGLCDIAETCTGTSATCPADAKKPDTFVCRASVGVCDKEEKCDGSSVACPADLFKLQGTNCGTCQECNGAGSCSQTPVDDTNCGTIDCDGLDTTCRNYNDLSTNRCKSLGVCKSPNSADCTVFTDAVLSTPCEADSQFCTVDHCDGNGACVFWKNYDCSANNLDEIAQCDYVPDGYLPTFDYAPAFTSTCDETKNECTIGTQTPSYTCADADANDGGPKIPAENGIRTCSAECDGFGTECLPYIGLNNYCYYNGQCNTDPTACSCSWAKDGYCPIAGTVFESNCYWGTRDCVNGDGQGGCTLTVTPMGCKDTCDPLQGPIDTTGPTTSNLVAPKLSEQCKINIGATETDTCSNIAAAEYFLGGATCGTPGTGDAMSVKDGSWDELIEDVIANSVDVSDLSLNIHVRGKDAAGNWGPCKTIHLNIDCYAPNYPTCYIGNTNPYYNPQDVGALINGECNAHEKLVCGTDPTLTANICDTETRIQLAEYFIDEDCDDPSQCLNWHGINMSATDGTFDELCEDVQATIDISTLSEGTHYLELHGKDGQENWAKWDFSPRVSFIKDTTYPATSKQLNPADGKHVTCGITQINGKTITDGCEYVKQGTTIELSATDPDPQGTGEFAGNVVIHYIVWWSYDGTSWSSDQTGQSVPGQPVTITLNKDSYHLVEYWSVDACGNTAPEHHFELDIVDTASPSIVKTIDGPSYGQCPPRPGTSDICFIDGVTKIHVVSTDPTPHPVDDVKCEWSYTVNGGSVIPGGTNVVPPFDINFPEESTHELTITCRDALGNSVTDVETFQVDKTPPTTTKTYGTPRYPDDIYHAKWITSQTQITLTVDDTGVHKSGIKETKYRVTLLGSNEPCQSDTVCQQQTGSGDFVAYASPFTIGQESCHLIEYYSVDNVDKTETVKKQCVFVENTAPVSQKALTGPQHACETGENLGIADCSYITQDTEVALTCSDNGDHPVDQVKIKYKVDWKQNSGDAWTEGSWIEDSDRVSFKYTKDSYHRLTWYCVDALGNTEAQHVELDIVDTQAPVSHKDLGDPKHACESGEQSLYYDPQSNPAQTDGCYFITQNTQVALTCADQQPHPVDHQKIFYRTYLAGTTPPAFTEDSGNVTFAYTEDSAHVLEWYCKDELGNTESTHVEYDIVDTQPPEGTKTVGDPKIEISDVCGNGRGWSIEASPGFTCTSQGKPVDCCATFQTAHVHDLGEVLKSGYVYMEFTPGLAPQCSDTAKFYYSVDGNSWTQFYSEAVTSVQLPGPTWKTYNTMQLVPAGFRYIKIEIPICMNDYSNVKYGYWVKDKATTVTLDCTDPTPHPVDHEKMCYKISFDDPTTPYLTSQYCAQFGGTMKGEECCVDVSGTNAYTFTFEEDSLHDLEYYCEDALENKNQVDIENFKVDSVPPTTTKAYLGPFYQDATGAHYIDTASTIKLDATDGGAICHVDGIKTYYKVSLVADSLCQNPACSPVHTHSDGWSRYVEPFPIAEESCHMIEFWSEDALGNKENVKAQCAYVDKTAPTTTKTYGTPLVEATPGGYPKWITSATSITLTVDDTGPHKSGIKETKYRVTQVADDKCASQTTCDTAVGSGSWNAYTTTPFTIAQDSCHLIEYYSVDNVDKTETTKRQCVYVDNKKPVINKVVGDPKIACDHSDPSGCDYWVRDHVTPIDLYCSDQQPHPVDHVKLWYRILLDGQVLQDWTDPPVPEVNKEIIFNEDSVHTLQYYCVDELGNSEGTRESPLQQVYRVDSTPPVTTKTVSDPKYGVDDYWVTSSTQFTLTSDDKLEPCDVGVDKIYYKIDWDKNCDGDFDDYKEQGIWQSTTDNPYTFTLQGECLHQISWYAVDALGNTEGTHVQLHKVDNTPPHVLILKPVDGWYSDGEDIPIVSVAEDLNNPLNPCERECGDSCGLGNECAVGIEDGAQCYAYLLDVLPQPKMVQLITDGKLLYNAEAKECQGYATIPQESGIPDGVTILVVSAKDNLGNTAGSLDEIERAICQACGCNSYDTCVPRCVEDAMQDIITLWNLPKIGIDNSAPQVTVTKPAASALVGKGQIEISADVTDSNDGDVTSTITSGTPCYVSLGGVNIGTLSYSASSDKCEGIIIVPAEVPQGERALKVEIADNAGNIGFGTVSVNVDTQAPSISGPFIGLIEPQPNIFVKGTVTVRVEVSDTNVNEGYLESNLKISKDHGNSWFSPDECHVPAYECTYQWNTALETDGIAYGLMAKVTDMAGNTGESAVVVVVVDNGEPESIAIVKPLNGDYLTYEMAGPMIEVVTADAVSGIERVEFYVDSVLTGTDYSQLNGWALEWDISSVIDGGHTLYAVAYDNQGNSLMSRSVSVNVDKTAPSVQITSPTESVWKKAGDMVEVSFLCDEANPKKYEVDIMADGGSTIVGHVESSDETMLFRCFGIAPSQPITEMVPLYGSTPEGTYDVVVNVYDKAGMKGNYNHFVVIKVDNYPPSSLNIYGAGIENLPYDTDGSYNIVWTGGSDTNFGRFDIVVDGATAGGVTSPYTGVPTEGAHRYQVVAYDQSGKYTVSSFFDVFVDTITPTITEGSQTSWGPVGWWFGYSIDDGAQSSGLLAPTYSGGLNICTWNPDTKSGSCLVIGSAESLTVHVKDKAGHSSSKAIVKSGETNTDFTPPHILATSPSGVIGYNHVYLAATTDEPSICKYGAEDDYAGMTVMVGSGTTSHSANLGTLEDGLKVYHVRCEDIVGNQMEQSKTVVFYIDTTGNYELVIPDYGHYWSAGWNTFFLPKLILDDICGDGGPYPVEQVLSSLDGSDPAYEIVWYFDGTDWLYFDPDFPGLSTLTEFNDDQSLPYYIDIKWELERLEITQDNCPVQPYCGDGTVGQSEQCELPETENCVYCAQSTQECSGYKLGTRDAYGNCDANCGCVNDAFNYQCVVGQCDAACAVDEDCSGGEICNTETCQCVAV